MSKWKQSTIHQNIEEAGLDNASSSTPARQSYWLIRLVLWIFWRAKAIYHVAKREWHRGDGTHRTFDHCLKYWWCLQYAEDQFNGENQSNNTVNEPTNKNVERFLEKYSQGSGEQNAAFYKLFRKAANEYSGLNGRRFTEIEKEIKRLRTALAVINTWASADSCNFQGRARAMSDIAKRSQVALGHHKPAEVPECNGGSFSL